jgi:hypothetical protein
MSAETLFWIAHLPALVGWVVLLAAPLVGPRAVTMARIAATLLALLYLLIFLFEPQGLRALARDYSLGGVGTLFADPRLVLLGWVHYLAFDLWVASWEAEEGRRLGIAHAWLAPAMFLTFMLGPLGLLLFLLIRALHRRGGGAKAAG